MHPACDPHRRCQNSVQTTRTGGADAGKSACTSVQGAARCKEMPLHLGAGAGRPELNRLNARCDLALCVALALRRAETLAVMKAAPKRKRSGITPDSCGKAGDPHNLEKGALAACPGHISKSRRRALDEGWDVAAQTAGESKGHPVDLD